MTVNSKEQFSLLCPTGEEVERYDETTQLQFILWVHPVRHQRTGACTLLVLRHRPSCLLHRRGDGSPRGHRGVRGMHLLHLRGHPLGGPGRDGEPLRGACVSRGRSLQGDGA